MARLHSETVASSNGSATGNVLFLHGIYGAGRNWRSIARAVVAARPDWQATLVDLRSHGRSPRLTPHTVAECARDVGALERPAGRGAPETRRAVLGHSFGGKVALACAREGALPGPLQLWIVDSNPGPGRSVDAPWRMLRVLRLRPGPFSSRAEAVAAVEAEGFGPQVARWMATNAQRSAESDEWRWRLDADAMEAYLRDYHRTDLWGVIEDPPDDCAVHVVKASASNVLDSADVQRARRAARETGRTFFHEVEGGHWLNVDNPAALTRLLAARLPGRAGSAGARPGANVSPTSATPTGAAPSRGRRGG